MEVGGGGVTRCTFSHRREHTEYDHLAFRTNCTSVNCVTSIETVEYRRVHKFSTHAKLPIDDAERATSGYSISLNINFHLRHGLELNNICVTTHSPKSYVPSYHLPVLNKFHIMASITKINQLPRRSSLGRRGWMWAMGSGSFPRGLAFSLYFADEQISVAHLIDRIPRGNCRRIVPMRKWTKAGFETSHFYCPACKLSSEQTGNWPMLVQIVHVNVCRVGLCSRLCFRTNAHANYIDPSNIRHDR